MPFNVTMEQPDAWVLGAEAQHNVSIRTDEDGVSAHGHGGGSGGVGGIVVAGFFVRSRNELEFVAVKMEGMFLRQISYVKDERVKGAEKIYARVVVVQDDFYDIAVAQDVGVRVSAVDLRIRGERARRQDRVEGWHFGTNIGDVVEEGTVEEGQ